MIVGGYVGFVYYNYKMDSSLSCKTVISELRLPNRTGREVIVKGYIDIEMQTKSIAITLDGSDGHVGRTVSITPFYDVLGRVRSFRIDRIDVNSYEKGSLASDFNILRKIGEEYPFRIFHINEDIAMYRFGSPRLFCERERD
jgi:hypothetical protein